MKRSGTDARPQETFLSLGLTMILLTACNFPTSTPPTAVASATAEFPAAQVRVELHGQGIQLEANRNSYAFFLSNWSSVDLEGIEVELAVPAQVRAIPDSGDPDVSPADDGGTLLTWRITTIKASQRLGPFSFTLEGLSPEASLHLRARWTGPASGELQASVEPAVDASQASGAASMTQGRLTEVSGTGVSFFVPLGDRGRVEFQRQDPETLPPSDAGSAWGAAYEVTKEMPGSLILVVPISPAAVPFSLVRVFADHGQGFVEQSVLGTVTADGLHAAFAAEGASLYGLSLGQVDLDLRQSQLESGLVDTIIPGAMEGLVSLADTLQMVQDLASLIASLHTDGYLEDVGWAIWGTISEITGTGGAGPGDTSGGGSVCTPSAFGYQVCENESDASCGGGGSTSINNSDGSRTVYCNDGRKFECNSAGVCVEVSSFAPIPGPCPYGVCMTSLTGDTYTLSQVDGLSDLAVDLFERTSGRTPEVPDFSDLSLGGERLDGTGLQAVVGLVGNVVLVVFPSSQNIQLSIGPPPTAATPPPAASITPTASAMLTPTSTRPPVASTKTPTPAPDTSGPSINSVSDSPDPIYVTQPNGCTPNASVVTSSITDASGVASAEVIFFHTTIGSIPMTHGSGNNWTASLGPYIGVGDGSVDYQIHTLDSLGNATDSGFFQITVLACIP